MIRKYHNHNLQTTPWHREEEPHNNHETPGLEVIKHESILRLKIKRNDWLLADTCPQAANHCALF